MDLQAIVRGFNCPINEEQSWAISHQYAKQFEELPHVEDYPLANTLESIYINIDGEISIRSTERTKSEREMVESFGGVVFDALQYGTTEDEEHPLSCELERLVKRMVYTYEGVLSEEVDEGYEGEHRSLDHGPCTWDVVKKICAEHLEQPSQADDHYLAVCRALISESLDLKRFLSQLSSIDETLRNLSNANNNNGNSDECDEAEDILKLNSTEWAHIWTQVVSDLRFGVKLRKVEGHERNIEYELTPYEILMKDIRQRKYTLKKISIDGEISSKVKSNAHDIILDYIKSGPTLNPIEERKLGPAPPRSKSLHERLMEEIQGPVSPLRRVGIPRDSPIHKSLAAMMEPEFQHTSMVTSKSCEFDSSRKVKSDIIKRRLAAPTLEEILRNNVSTTTTDDETTPTSEDDSSSFAIDSIATDDMSTTFNDDSITSLFERHHPKSRPCSLRSSGTSGVSSGVLEEPEATNLENHGKFQRNTTTVRRKKVLSVDLPSPILSTTPGSSVDPAHYHKYSSRNGVRRATSMCAPRTGALDDRRVAWRERLTGPSQKVIFEERDDHLFPLPPPAGSSSPLAKREKRGSWEFTTQGMRGLQRTSSDRRPHGPMMMHEKLSYPVECVGLTVEELMHIREVLTRAELEKYQGQAELYCNLKFGKVCFNCRIRKFSLFWWSFSCQICKRKICSKCMRKVRTPTDEYLHTPVYTLSPPVNPLGPFKAAFNTENTKPQATRISSSTSSNVLREKNGVYDSNQKRATLQQQESSWGLGFKSRKMDVCESCCELISRIVHTTRIATNHRTPRPTWLDNSNNGACASNNFERYMFARPSANRFLKRSTSSVTMRTSYLQRPMGSSLSTQNFRRLNNGVDNIREINADD
ncbi:protein spire homolog 1-like isoform X1 [Styela clava]